MSTNRPPLRRDTRVFISGVSRELGTVRKEIKKALEDSGYHAVEQNNFPLDYRQLTDKLRKLIDSCDAVIHVAGRCYGAEPRAPPENVPRRSFTQLEYDIARELRKPVYVFITVEGFPTDSCNTEDEEKTALQEAHRDALTQAGTDYCSPGSREEIDHKVRSLPLRIDTITDELTRVDDKVVASGRRLGWKLTVLLLLSLLTISAAGFIAWQQQQQRAEARTAEQTEIRFAERFLEQLISNRDLTAAEARQRAIAELPALVDLPLEAIRTLIDGKIASRVPDAALSPLERARAALATGDYDEVFAEAEQQRTETRELAMLEGTAALARFRESPEPQWNERALAAFQRALALSDAQSEPLAWSTAALSVAFVMHGLARYAEAEPLLRETLSLLENALGVDHPYVATTLNNLAGLLRATNRLAEAEPLFRRALAIIEASYGPEHPYVATPLNNLAELLRATNRLAEAEPLMRRVVTIFLDFTHRTGHTHPHLQAAFSNYQNLLEAMGKSEAEIRTLIRTVIDESGAESRTRP